MGDDLDKFHKNNKHKGEIFEEYLDSFNGLGQQIGEIIDRNPEK